MSRRNNSAVNCCRKVPVKQPLFLMILHAPRLRLGLVLLTLSVALVAPSRADDQPSPLAPNSSDSGEAMEKTSNSSAHGLGGQSASGDAPWRDRLRNGKNTSNGWVKRVELSGAGPSFSAMRSWGNGAGRWSPLGLERCVLSLQRSRHPLREHPFPEFEGPAHGGPGAGRHDARPGRSLKRKDGSVRTWGQVKASLFHHVFSRPSFFKTKDIKNDFNNELVNGLVPAMVVFLAKEGYSIDSLQYVDCFRRTAPSTPRAAAPANPGRPDHL